jgi:hypothetical protein
MTRNAPKAKRTAAVTQHCTPMEMTRSKTPAELAGRQRRLASSSPWGGPSMAVEEEAEGPLAAAGGTIFAPPRDGRPGWRKVSGGEGWYFWEATGTPSLPDRYMREVDTFTFAIAVLIHHINLRRRSHTSHYLNCLHISGVVQRQ